MALEGATRKGTTKKVGVNSTPSSHAISSEGRSPPEAPLKDKAKKTVKKKVAAPTPRVATLASPAAERSRRSAPHEAPTATKKKVSKSASATHATPRATKKLVTGAAKLTNTTSAKRSHPPAASAAAAPAPAAAAPAAAAVPEAGAVSRKAAPVATTPARPPKVGAPAQPVNRSFMHCGKTALDAECVGEYLFFVQFDDLLEEGRLDADLQPYVVLFTQEDEHHADALVRECGVNKVCYDLAEWYWEAEIKGVCGLKRPEVLRKIAAARKLDRVMILEGRTSAAKGLADHTCHIDMSCDYSIDQAWSGVQRVIRDCMASKLSVPQFLAGYEEACVELRDFRSSGMECESYDVSVAVVRPMPPQASFQRSGSWWRLTESKEAWTAAGDEDEGAVAKPATKLPKPKIFAY